MAKAPRVLLLIESARGFGRSLLKGFSEYARFHGPWCIDTSGPFFRRSAGKLHYLDKDYQSSLDGIVVRDMDELPALQKMKLPTVMASTVEPEAGKTEHSFPVITTDNEAIARQAAEHLFQREFTRFAYCGYEGIQWSELRAQQFSRIVAEAGHSLYVYQAPRSKAKRKWANELPALCAWLEGLPKPIGLMTCCDDRSQDIVEAAIQSGIRVPEEIAVIGVDNDELLCNLANPPLSSVALATEKAGFQAAQLLDRIMQGQERMAGQRIVVAPTHVVSRSSTDTLPVEDADVIDAVQFIRNHVQKQVQVADVVAATCLSRRTLERRFLATLGRSVQHEINRQRTDRIASMLLQTRMTQVEIAQTMGYTSVDNLRRFFQRHMQMTPLVYQRKFGHA
jgi:LacI family transcriptional regulator